MKTTYLVLGRGFEGFENGNPIGVPKSLRTFTSKFDKMPGDVMNVDNMDWIVMSVGDTCLDDAKEVMRGMSNLYVTRGFWDGIKTKKVS